MTTFCAAALWLALWKLRVAFPGGFDAQEQILLRWIHFLAGITWVGLLYFFNLVNVPVMKALDAPTKGKIIPVLLPKALWWFRWGAVVTVLVGFRYFMIYAASDAAAAHDSSLTWQWIGIWFLVWVVAWALINFLLMPKQGALNDGKVLAVLIAIVVIAAGYVVLRLLSHPDASNRMLSISVGGGLGLVMLLNVWGIIWRCQKKIIAWTKANAEQGTPMPPEAAKLARQAFLASRANAWLSIPMLFFMAASSHYQLFSGVQ